MKLSKPHSHFSLPATEAPMHQRSTLIELLTTLAVIGILIFDKQKQ